jgi:hypothetical protein
MNRGMAMIRIKFAAVAAALLLAGCVTDYGYRGGSGDYYYGRSGSYYGAPYSTIGYGYPGGWYGHVGYSYGYGYPYRRYPGYGYYSWYHPYYGYPYSYWPPYRHPRPRPDRPREPDVSGPVMGGQRPPMRRPTPPAQESHSRLPPTGGVLPPDGRDPSYRRGPRMDPGGQPMVRPRQAPPSAGQMPARRAESSQPMARPQPAPVRAAEPRAVRPAPAARPAPRTDRAERGSQQEP